MTNDKRVRKSVLRKALFSSVISLVLCCTMLIGTTFAWFTDSVTSTSNIIKSGTLDVEMGWADAKEDPASVTYADASQGAIFNYDLWEPGYVQARHILIENKGTLALKYSISIEANGEVSELSDVIDVYYCDPATQITDRTALTEDMKLGTLTNVLAGMATSAAGELLAGEKHNVTIVLKMQETAGNTYQNKSIGSDFNVKLLATQLTAEEDSFDNQYDKEAVYPEVISTLADLQAKVNAAKDGDVITLGANISGTLVMPKDSTTKITIDGNGYSLGSVNLNGADNKTLKNIKFNAANAVMGYDGYGNAKQYANIVTDDTKNSSISAAQNIVIDSCTFTGKFASGGVAISFTDQKRATSGNVTIMNCTFETTGGFYDIYEHYSGFGYLEIKNNTFKSELHPQGKPIYLGRYSSSTPVVVTGNTFEIATSFETAASIQDHSSYGVSFDASDNTFASVTP